MRKRLEFPYNYRLKGLLNLAFVLIAAGLAACLIYVWINWPQYWTAYLLILPAIPFLALWPGTNPDYHFPIGDPDPGEAAIEVLYRLSLIVPCFFLLMEPDTPRLVYPLLVVPMMYFTGGLCWRSFVGAMLIAASPIEAISTVRDNIRFIFAMHPMHRTLETAFRENRDLTPSERLAWEAYLVKLALQQPPPKQISENGRVRLLAYRAWINRERQLAYNSIDQLRVRRAMIARMARIEELQGEEV